MSQSTATIDALVDRYIAIWNETDPARRRALIDETWAEDATYRDPVLSGDGRDGIDAMTGGFLATYPGHTFERRGEVTVDGDTITFAWALRNEAGEEQLSGTDVGTLDDAGRLRTITGTFDAPPPTS